MEDGWRTELGSGFWKKRRLVERKFSSFFFSLDFFSSENNQKLEVLKCFEVSNFRKRKKRMKRRKGPEE